MSTCDCFRGAPAEVYEPKGSFTVVGHVRVYKSTPTPQSHDSVPQNILFLPDGFGLASHNVRLADMYASHGYATTIVDYFDGDALPECFMKYTPGTDLNSYDSLTLMEKEIIRGIDMDKWQKCHGPDHIASVLDRLLEQYYEDTIGTSHIVAHCFGGKSAFRLAKSKEFFSSVVVFHPAFLESSDIEELRLPVFLGCAETDVFTPTLSTDMLSLLPRSGCNYKLTVYGATKHGFASRADTKDEIAIEKFIDAFKDGLSWLKSYSTA